MNAKRQLVQAYESWEHLTRAEGFAIQGQDWTQVAQCQRNKRALQQQIILLTAAARAECLNAGQDPEQLQRDLGATINQLIAQETRNAQHLASCRHTAQRHKLALDQATQNLRRVHKSYTTPSPAVWNCYS
jgi:hypothetical protein